MSREKLVTKFKCEACNGAGGSGPIRIMTGLPFHPCMYCGGKGELTREVSPWEGVEFYSAEETERRLQAMLRGAFAGHGTPLKDIRQTWGPPKISEMNYRPGMRVRVVHEYPDMIGKCGTILRVLKTKTNLALQVLFDEGGTANWHHTYFETIKA